jgi:hypothetical protein
MTVLTLFRAENRFPQPGVIKQLVFIRGSGAMRCGGAYSDAIDGAFPFGPFLRRPARMQADTANTAMKVL